MSQEQVDETFLIGFDDELQSVQALIQNLGGMPTYQTFVRDGVLKVHKVRESGKKHKGQPNVFPIAALDFKHRYCPWHHVFECNDRAFNSVACSRWSTLSQCCTENCRFNYFEKASLASHIRQGHPVQEVKCSLCSESFTSLHYAERHFNEQHNLEGDVYICIHEDGCGGRCGHLFRRKDKYMAHFMNHWGHRAQGSCQPVQEKDYTAVDILVFIAMVRPAKMREARQFKYQQLQLASKLAPPMPLGVEHHGIERLPRDEEELEQIALQGMQKALSLALVEGQAAAMKVCNSIRPAVRTSIKKRILDEPAFRKLHRHGNDDDDNSDSPTLCERTELPGGLAERNQNCNGNRTSDETYGRKELPSKMTHLVAGDKSNPLKENCATPPRRMYKAEPTAHSSRTDLVQEETTNFEKFYFTPSTTERTASAISPANMPKVTNFLRFDGACTLVNVHPAADETEAEDVDATLPATPESNWDVNENESADEVEPEDYDSLVWSILDNLDLQPYLAYLDEVSNIRSTDTEDDVSTVATFELMDGVIDAEEWSALESIELDPYLTYLDEKSHMRSMGFKLTPPREQNVLAFPENSHYWGETANHTFMTGVFPDECSIQPSLQKLPVDIDDQVLDLLQALDDIDGIDWTSDQNDFLSYERDLVCINPNPFCVC